MADLTPVLHLVNGEQYSGLERVVDHLVGGAPSRGFRIDLVLLKPRVMRERMHSTCESIYEYPMRSRLDLSVWHAAARIAVEAGHTLVHSHTVRSALVARRVKQVTGLPWVHHVHSPALHESDRRRTNLANFVAEAAVMRHADSIVAVSRPLADYVVRYYRIAPDRVSVVPNGVSCEPGVRVKAPSSRLRTVGTVGLFRPRKGIEHLIDAARLLIDHGHDLRVRLAGEFADSRYEASVRQRIRRLGLSGRVEFVGFVKDVRSELNACDVFTLPSLYGEGMPMAMLEAMACAKPIVASEIDGIRELLADGAGLMVPPGSDTSLANAIGRVLADPRLADALGAEARCRQQRYYSVEAMQDAVFCGYGKLLASRASDNAHPRPS